MVKVVEGHSPTLDLTLVMVGHRELLRRHYLHLLQRRRVDERTRELVHEREERRDVEDEAGLASLGVVVLARRVPKFQYLSDSA